ncbi:MAG: prolyl oligopeptidase family serine peptidase [Acidobacteriota bacterium]
MRCLAGFALVILSFAGREARAVEPAVLIAEWQVVGPFAAGSREGFVHHLADGRGRLPETFSFEGDHPSLLPDGGRATWRVVKGERDAEGRLNGRIPLDFSEVDWDMRESEWGFSGVLNAAYCVGTFELERDELLLLDAARFSGTINGVPHVGDLYDHDLSRSIVRGRAGRNTVVFRSTGYGPTRKPLFRLLRVSPGAGELLVLEKDVLLPDAVVGRAGEGWAGVPVLNLTDSWLADVTIELSGPGLRGSVTSPFPLAPFAVQKVPVPVSWTAASAVTEKGAPLPVTLTIRTAEGVTTLERGRVVRAAEERRLVSFLSRMDRSAQVYGLSEPVGGPSPERDGLVLRMHGAGVGPRGALQDFDWAWTVAATNRRRFGFDWHDFGRLDFEEVRDLALASLPIDPDRVTLEGNSMGGHGAWVQAVHHSDWFASVTPAAGWVGYDFYVPFTGRRSKAFASPELDSLHLRSLAPGRVSLFLDNLTNVPVRVFHGSRDATVPPVQARLLAGALDRRDHDVALCEAPDGKHWGHDNLRGSKKEPSGCLDASLLREFQVRQRRQPDPRRVVFVTTDPDIDPDRHWVEILQQRKVATDTRIEAEIVSPSRIEVSTRNVEAFALDLGERLERAGIELARAVIVQVGEQELTLRRRGSGMRFELKRRAGRWRARAVARPTEGEVFPNRRPGGMAKAMFRPFLLVAGTRGGDATRQESLLHLGRHLAQHWWRRANGFAPIVRDVDLTDELRERHELVLLGGPDLNHETHALRKGLNVVATHEGVRLAGRPVPGRELAAAHWQPDPRADERRVLVFQSTTATADSLLPLLDPIPPGAGLPDYVIAGPEVRARSWGGFRAAGFWTPDWRLDPSNGWRAAD